MKHIKENPSVIAEHSMQNLTGNVDKCEDEMCYISMFQLF